MAVECGLAAVVIVGVEPLVETGDAFVFGAVRAGVGPFLEHGPVQPFHLPVGLGPVGPGPFVGDGVAQGSGEDPGPVAGAVVGQDSLHGDPDGFEVGVGASPEAGGGFLAFVVVELAEAQSGVVVDGGVDVPLSGSALA